MQLYNAQLWSWRKGGYWCCFKQAVHHDEQILLVSNPATSPHNRAAKQVVYTDTSTFTALCEQYTCLSQEDTYLYPTQHWTLAWCMCEYHFIKLKHPESWCLRLIELSSKIWAWDNKYRIPTRGMRAVYAENDWLIWRYLHRDGAETQTEPTREQSRWREGAEKLRRGDQVE